MVKMDELRRTDELRRKTNPLFNDRKLKLGTFCTNLDYGAAMSTIEGTLRISWPNTLALAKIANEMDFEALVPVGRWRGFGGLDGILLTWARYEDGMREFQQKTLPLVIQAGLR